MSSVAISGNASGAGVLTIAAPNTASNFTMTLPAATGILLSSAGALVTTPTNGLGYATGAGGNVTQATSKTTSVTLNTPSGQITMNNAALAAGASVSFLMNNSLIANSDIVVINCNFAGGLYDAKVRNIGTGAAAIIVTNISGGSLTDAVTMNFAIIKGATS
jgi:hypothetical protein